MNKYTITLSNGKTTVRMECMAGSAREAMQDALADGKFCGQLDDTDMWKMRAEAREKM